MAIKANNFGQTVKAMDKTQGGIGAAVSAAAKARNIARKEAGLLGKGGKNVSKVNKTY